MNAAPRYACPDCLGTGRIAQVTPAHLAAGAVIFPAAPCVRCVVHERDQLRALVQELKAENAALRAQLARTGGT